MDHCTVQGDKTARPGSERAQDCSMEKGPASEPGPSLIRNVERLFVMMSNTGVMLSMALLLGVMFFTTADVTGRVLGHPIPGSYQISELVLVWIVCLAWPFAAGTRVHVRMEILLLKLPPRIKETLEHLTSLLTLCVFGLIFWQGIEMIQMTIRLNELVSIIDVPLYPFLIIVPLGALLVCPVLLIQLAKSVAGRQK
ncbi:MAG: TRAP transporter small permease [Thermodesulfobacteriota bacterium]